jgi:hypothetical protein
VSAEVPHNIHIHQQGATLNCILPVFASLKTALDLQGIPKTSLVVSVVKGFTYASVNVTERPDIFANIGLGGSPVIDTTNNQYTNRKIEGDRDLGRMYKNGLRHWSP